MPPNRKLDLYWPDKDSRSTHRRSPIPPLDGLIIEAGGVLFDDSCWQRWLLQLLSYMGMQTRFDAFYRVWEVEYLPSVWRGQWDYWDAFGDYLRSCGMPVGRCDEVVVAAKSRRLRMESNRRAFPGAAAALARLVTGGVRIIAAFNSAVPASELETKLDAVGLGGMLEKVFSSVDLGETIDSEGFVDAVITETGLNRAGLALCSNRPDSLCGARHQSLFTFAVDCRRKIDVDRQIASVTQLPDLMATTRERMAAG